MTAAERIRSDDPDAIDKLRAKLAKMEHNHEMMKKCNAIIRKKPKDQPTEAKMVELVGLGLMLETAQRLFERDYAGRIGIAAYVGQNRSANMRRVRDRIAELEAHRTQVNVWGNPRSAPLGLKI